MHLTQGQKAKRAQEKKGHRRGGKKGRKIGRKHRNGKPFGRRGDCGCITCRARGTKMC